MAPVLCNRRRIQSDDNRSLQNALVSGPGFAIIRHMPFIAKNAVLPSQADITSEQRILEPEKDGLEGIPAVSFAQYSTNWKALPEDRTEKENRALIHHWFTSDRGIDQTPSLERAAVFLSACIFNERQ